MIMGRLAMPAMSSVQFTKDKNKGRRQAAPATALEVHFPDELPKREPSIFPFVVIPMVTNLPPR
jgi:hypothetical protein